MKGHIAIMHLSVGIRNRHPIYTYISCYIKCYIGHNPVCYNTCYIARYMMYFGYNLLYRKNPVRSNICYITDYI